MFERPGYVDCPNCHKAILGPDEPTDEGGAEFMCKYCLASLYQHASWPGAGEWSGKVQVL